MRKSTLAGVILRFAHSAFVAEDLKRLASPFGVLSPGWGRRGKKRRRKETARV